MQVHRRAVALVSKEERVEERMAAVTERNVSLSVSSLDRQQSQKQRSQLADVLWV